MASAHTKFSDQNLILRTNADGNKTGPCGKTAPGANAPRTEFKAGQRFEIIWFETIDHPSKYHIAFSADETDNFSLILMDLDDFDNDEIRPEDLPQKQDVDGRVPNRINNPRAYTYTITVPNIPCERCSLQLIQRMYDRNPPTNYFSCADIKIVPEGGLPPAAEPDNPSPDLPADAGSNGDSEGAQSGGKLPAVPTGLTTVSSISSKIYHSR